MPKNSEKSSTFARIESVPCDGVYVNRIDFTKPLVEGNMVTTNYDEAGNKLSIDCPFIITGMCTNLRMIDKARRIQKLSGTYPCMHLNPTTPIKR